MPLPSEGCQACRARKVRCDQFKPTCHRCTKAGRECPGYRSKDSTVFRNMNREAETKVKARVVKSVSLRMVTCIREPVLPVQGDTLSGSGLMRCDGTSTWQEGAVSSFFADYQLPSDVMKETLYPFLSRLCQGHIKSEPLQESFYAAAFASQGNQLGLHWMITEASLAYDRALAAIGKTLQDESLSTDDSTLAATFFLGFYEVLSGVQKPGGLWSHHHSHGRTTLIRLRGNAQFDDKLKRSIIRTSNQQMTMLCLMSHTQPAEEMEEWLNALELRTPNTRNQVQFTRLNLKVIRLCVRAHELFTTNDRTAHWVLDLLQVLKEAILIDLEYQDHSETVTGAWRYSEVRTSLRPLPSNIATESFDLGSSLYIYHDIWIAMMWNIYRGCRIHLHEVILHCIDLLDSFPPAQALSIDSRTTRTQSRIIIEDMISDICSSVPFCLGDISSSGQPVMAGKRMPLCGYLLMAPLYIVNASSNPGSSREAWVEEKLEYISRVMGIHRASLFATRTKRPAWDLT